MFNIGGGEILVIALIALIAVGPEQLPSVMRKMGGFVNQVRTMTTGIRDEFMSAVDEADPNKWMGDGSKDEPIVPRGYAENTVKSSSDPSADAVAKATEQTAADAARSDESEESDDSPASDAPVTNEIAAKNTMVAKDPVVSEEPGVSGATSTPEGDAGSTTPVGDSAEGDSVEGDA